MVIDHPPPPAKATFGKAGKGKNHVNMVNTSSVDSNGTIFLNLLGYFRFFLILLGSLTHCLF